MMKKSEQAAGCTGVAYDLLHAGAALPVYVLDAKSAASRTAIAKPASTSQGMQ